MKQVEHHIYNENDCGLIEGPYTICENKWIRSIKKRASALRKLFSKQPGRIRERIAEYPYTIGAMAALPAGSKVADLGGASSMLALELVYLGHEVYVLDLRRCPLKHPKLQARQINAFDNDLPDDLFDAMSCISVIEHVGIVRYGGREQVDGDFAMITEARRLIKPGGFLILSAPYGQGHDPAAEGEPKGFRAYDRERLDKLTQDFEITDLKFFVIENGVWLDKPQAVADQTPVARPVCCIFLANLKVKDNI